MFSSISPQSNLTDFDHSRKGKRSLLTLSSTGKRERHSKHHRASSASRASTTTSKAAAGSVVAMGHNNRAGIIKPPKSFCSAREALAKQIDVKELAIVGN